VKTFVVIPTYNESQNIEALIQEILGLRIDGLSILVVDDSSPDGTSQIVAGLSERHPEVRLVQRIGDKGRGTAGIVGFEVAMRLGADAIIEMDADFSHPPEVLPRLLAGLAEMDIVIASRLAPGAEDVRPWRRRIVTRFSNLYARYFLERAVHASRIRDWTTGFRAYRRAVFERLPPSQLVSRGPSILQEILFRSLNMGATAMEIPFRMSDRVRGASSFSRKVAWQSLRSIPAYSVLFGAGQEYRISTLEFAEVGARVTHVKKPSSTASERNRKLKE